MAHNAMATPKIAVLTPERSIGNRRNATSNTAETRLFPLVVSALLAAIVTQSPRMKAYGPGASDGPNTLTCMGRAWPMLRKPELSIHARSQPGKT